VALLLLLSVSVASQSTPTSSDETLGIEVVHDETFSEGIQPPLTLRFAFHSSSRHGDRIVATTKDALRVLTDWLGPNPATQLTVVDTAWSHDRRVGWSAVAERRGDERSPTLVVSSRWRAPLHEASIERLLIASIARTYFVRTGSAGAFAEGVAYYVATRAMNQLLEGRHTTTMRLFGGFVPVVIRPLALSRTRRDPRPPIRSYEHLGGPGVSAEAERASDALYTLERAIGWPSIQQALFEFAPQARAGASEPAAFAAVASRQLGQDIGWFFDAALRPSTRFDYGVASLVTRPTATAGAYETVVTVRRYADVFPRADRLGDVLTRFADGSQARERWDGAAEEASVTYTSTSPAVAAAVDAQAVFLLDANRTNNSRVLQPPLSTLVARHALNWLTWLENVALTYTALV
jgi:hypothetical protein